MGIPDLALGIPDVSLVVFGLALAVGGFLVGHGTSHRAERERRHELAAEYQSLAKQWYDLACRMEADDRLRAGIEIGVDHTLSLFTNYLRELTRERETRQGDDR